MPTHHPSDAQRSPDPDNWAEGLIETTRIVLSDEAFDTLLERLENPPPPTQALRDLMAGVYDAEDPPFVTLPGPFASNITEDDGAS